MPKGLNALLAFINYNSDASKQGKALADDVLAKLYDISTLVPAIFFLIMALVLFFGFDLTQNKVTEMHNALMKQREETD